MNARNQIGALLVAMAAAGCDVQFDALTEIQTDGLERAEVTAASNRNATESVPAGAVAAVVQHVIAGYLQEGNAYMQNANLTSTVPGARSAGSIGEIVSGGGRVNDFLVRVEAGAFETGQVPVSIYLEGVNPPGNPLGESWGHSHHFIAKLRPDGSWAVTRDESKPAFTS